MAYDPVKGKFAKLAVKGTPDTILPGINWTLPINGNPQDASNFRDGRKVMVTLDDADVTFTLIIDGDALPTEAANGNIKIGTVFDGKFFVNNAMTLFYEAPVMVTQTDVVNEGMTGRTMLNVTAKLNGDIVYPVVA